MNRFGVARFILADMYRMAPGPVLAVAPLGLVNSVARLLGAGLLIQFIGSYAGNGNGPRIDVLWFDLGIDVSPARAWIWVAIIGVTAVAASGIGYLTTLMQLRIGRRYSLHAATRTLRKLVEQPYQGRINFDPSYFVFGASALLGMITPALTAIAFGIAMFVLRPWLSVVVTAAAIVFLGPVMIATGRRIMHATQRRRSTRNVMREHADPALSLLAAGPLYDPELRQAAVDDYVVDDTFNERFEAVFQIRANQQLARLMSGLLTAATAVILAVGLTIAEEPNSIDVGRLILYVVVAQIATNAVGQIGVGLATFSRHLYAYQGYVDFVSDATEPVEPTDPVHIGRVWLVRDRMPPPPSRLLEWMEAIGLDPSSRVSLTLDPGNFPSVSLGALLTGGRESEPERLARCAEFVDLVTERPLEPGTLHRTVGEISDESLLSAATLGPAALERRPTVVVIALRTFGLLERDLQKVALSRLDHHHVVLVGTGRDYVEEYADRVLDEVELAPDKDFEDLEEDDE